MSQEVATTVMSIDEIKKGAAAVAAELRNVPASAKETTPPGGGSHHRGLPIALQKRFIDVRAALFQRGLFDPVLVRFDTASAPQAANAEIAEELAALAASL